MEWTDDWAQEWDQEGVDFGSTRKEDFADGHEACPSKEAFDIWMQCVLTSRESGSDGFYMGRRTLQLVETTLRSNKDSRDHCNRLQAV